MLIKRNRPSNRLVLFFLQGVARSKDGLCALFTALGIGASVLI